MGRSATSVSNREERCLVLRFRTVPIWKMLYSERGRTMPPLRASPVAGAGAGVGA